MRSDQANDDDLVAATTAATWPSVGKWFTGFDFGLCIGGFFFFFFDKHLYALCLVCWVLCLPVWFAFVLGLISLLASDDATWCQAPATWWVDWVQFLTLYFFLVENGLAVARERATCNGLAVGLACHGWAWFCYICIFFFSDFSSNFFWVFFFFFLLESRTDKFFFFNLMVFLIFVWGLRELVGNGWRGRLWNVGGAYFFFLHSLMGKKKFL